MSVSCKSCGAAILWALTDNGKRMPVNAEPVENGNLLLVADEDGPRAIYATQGTHVSHFATCPYAENWRKR